jgi:predicted lipoprotein with Yx(FWY)xxD motif
LPRPWNPLVNFIRILLLFLRQPRPYSLVRLRAPTGSPLAASIFKLFATIADHSLSARNPNEVSTRTPSERWLLTDGSMANGLTLYMFARDHGTISACKKAECAKLWPALTATGGRVRSDH